MFYSEISLLFFFFLSLLPFMGKKRMEISSLVLVLSFRFAISCCDFIFSIHQFSLGFPNMPDHTVLGLIPYACPEATLQGQ